MYLKSLLQKSFKKFLVSKEIHSEVVLNISVTRKGFPGDYSIVLFPLLKMFEISLHELSDELGSFLQNELKYIEGYNHTKGFLNLELTSDYWWHRNIFFNENQTFYLQEIDQTKKVLVEYASPNTNKPLHLGHIRNILLGWSVAKILEASGEKVIKTQVINDRGIAVCKSMLAWKLFGAGETPEKSGIKGDFLVGKYYVLFNQKLEDEYIKWQVSDVAKSVFKEFAAENEDLIYTIKRYKNQYFNEYSELGAKAKQMLVQWEEGDEETVSLWQKMNNWTYKGFEETYKNLGITFDRNYYESNTYLLGKYYIERGLEDNVFYKKSDGSIWIDLEDVGMDHKILLRSDGTSVYMTQDIGTAEKRYEDTNANKVIYVVGDEQNYHFQALFEIMKKLNKPYAHNMYHLSYGMVDLPTGKMKSREGNVVEADDLMREVIEEAQKNTKERSDISTFNEQELLTLNRKIGLGALKYFILKVNAKRRMTFNPKESVDMQGNTGPYIQNAYVRIRSIQRKNEGFVAQKSQYTVVEDIEKQLIQQLDNYQEIILESAKQLDPSIIANFAYALAKSFHKFYHEIRILNCPDFAAKQFRSSLIENIANVLKHSMFLLGIEMPERM